MLKKEEKVRNDIVLYLDPWSHFFKNLSQIFAIITAFVLPISTTALIIFLMGSVICYLLSGGLSEKYAILHKNPVALMFLLFFSLFLFGLTYTTAQLTDALHVLVKYSKFLLGFFLFGVFRNKKTARYAFYAFLLAATITLLFSYTKFFLDWNFLNRFRSDSGVFKDHIFTGFLLAFSAYVYALLAFSLKKKSWLFGILFFLTLYAVLFINLGRSGYIVFFSLMLLLAWQQFYWKGLIVALLTAVFLCTSLLFLPVNFKNRFSEVSREIHQYNKGEIDTSTGLRLDFYKNSLKLWYRYPWFGTGTGSFSYEYSIIAKGNQCLTRNPHNEYLNIAIQFGLLGIVILFSLFYIHWITSFRLPLIKQCLAQAILVAIAVGSLFNSWLMDVTQGNFYIFFTALIFANLSKF